MEIPETRYARRAGLHVGYQVWGEGALDILDVGCGTYISIDETGEQPQWRRYIERLATCGRVMRFDPSGIGMSDTPTDLGQLTFESWVDDALAVMDACDSSRAVVVGASSGSFVALLFAAQHPERTESLVVINGSTRYIESDDYPIGISLDLMAEFRAGLDPDVDVQGNEDLSDLRLFAPSSADDPEFQRWWSRASKRGAPPATAAALGDLSTSSDVRHLLPLIAAPTLVLHRRHARAPTVDHGRYIADNIVGARLVVLPGSDVMPFTGDLDGLVDEVEEFITGERYGPTPERILATILFTDIVDSTSTAARMGDRHWTQVLRDHDLLVRRQLEHFGGQFVKDTGDGLLAIFDGPTRAVRCALTIRDGATHLGIEVRAGLHAGEIERRGEDVSGIAVHVAARVVAEAAAGEVMVSGTIVDLVEGAGISFVDRGIYPLKGVPDPRRLWSVASA